MQSPLRIFVCLLACLAHAGAQELAPEEKPTLVPVTWPTKLAAKPYQLDKPASDFLPIFRLGLLTLKESQIVALALSQPSFLGLTEKSAVELQGLAAARYQLIEADPLFSKAASALPYCFSAQTPADGYALVYLPPKSTATTPVLVFLHGYGGSFLWYQHLMAEIFPNHIIICPAYGINPSTITVGYVTECLDAVAKKIGHPLAKPQLMGLSAGGFGACRIYSQSPATFSRLLVIAAFPPEETIALFHKGMSAAFIGGGAEGYMNDGYFTKAMDALKARGVTVQSHVVADADHFFLLSHKEESIQFLREWEPAAPALPKPPATPAK